MGYFITLLIGIGIGYAIVKYDLVGKLRSKVGI